MIIESHFVELFNLKGNVRPLLKENKFYYNYSFRLLKFHKKDTRGKRLLKKKMKNYSNNFIKIDCYSSGHLSDSLDMFMYFRKLTMNRIKSISIHGRGNYSPGDLCNTQISFDEARGKDTKILEAYNPKLFIPKI